MSESLCKRCSRMGKTCCQRAEIYVSPGDVRRIASALGRMNFYEFAPPVDPSYLEDNGDPDWMQHVFRQDGSRRVLKRRTDGTCSFLTDSGCGLDMETRPLVCRLYPFDFDAGHVFEGHPDYCPSALFGNHSVCQSLEMSTEEAERWRRQLYDEIHSESADNAA